ncbi:MAG: 5'-nucleotidase, lipoprotein e(P4) family [Fusobacterium sp.]|uniref:5'-nucleotidase, lipoprotein e(P4) family n=1 Tax=Fusobacterium sp. TaxID=68766 RepID=UPI0026DAB39D|nr:5'-nucleotidase, lipoprotein e(P4) family [Fusobacterium sp.]MDO4690381.1 5'-nucleotidase, lipoprotein e(P4) family [Fusobacterium sp.]
MKKFFLFISLLTVVACTNAREIKQEDKISLTYEELRSEQNVMSTNWFQTSGEAKALFIQAYNIATQRLKEHLKKPSEKPYSIVLDLDETVLDNSVYSAENIKKGRNWSKESWNEWVNMSAAGVLPGAKDFLELANKNKVEIYYISDRYEEHLDATIKNLKKLGLPVQSRAHVLLKGKNDKSGKVNRRDYVKNHTNLIMLFGDNLSDFEEFSTKSIEDRNKKVEELAKEFGTKFIVFPNPMYGAFETAIYGGKFGDAKDLINARRTVLRNYENISR